MPARPSLVMSVEVAIIFLLVMKPSCSGEENYIKVCNLKELQAARSRICSFYKRADNSLDFLMYKRYPYKRKWLSL